jgi:hypothetical protein
MILYPAKYIEITLRLRELTPSDCIINAVASSVESEDLNELGMMDKELFVSRTMLTRSPALRFISFIHFFGKERMYVDLPVNCILRTSFLPFSDIEINGYYNHRVVIHFIESIYIVTSNTIYNL